MRVKFTPDGGKIFFRAKEILKENEKIIVHFEIEDTGIGMSITKQFAELMDGITATKLGKHHILRHAGRRTVERKLLQRIVSRSRE